VSALPQQRKGWCPGALKPMETGDGLLVRVRASGGRLSLDQAAAIADAALVCGNGVIGLSSRANIQIRGVSQRSLPELHVRLADAALLDADPEVERLRNIVASPLSDIDPDAAFDLAPCVAALEARLAEDESLRPLPAKFGFVLDASGRLPLGDIEADIRFEALPETPRAFAVYLCGDDARAAMCAQKDVGDVAAQLGRAFLLFSGKVGARSSSWPPFHVRQAGTLADGWRDPRNEPRRRMHALVATVGAPAIFVAAGLEAKPRLRSPKRALLGDALGTHENNGAVVVGAAAPFGHIHAENLKVLVARARDAGAANVRLAPWRTFFVTGLERAAAASFSAACEDLGFITDASDARLRIVACSGAPACLHANRPVREDSARLARVLPEGDGVLLHVSGCKKGCARPYPTAATLVATEAGYELVVNGKPSDAPTVSGLSADAAEAWLAREVAKLFGRKRAPA